MEIYTRKPAECEKDGEGCDHVVGRDCINYKSPPSGYLGGESISVGDNGEYIASLV